MILKKTLFPGLMLLAFSCSQREPPLSVKQKPAVTPPKITVLADLPDSLKPVKIFLKKPLKRVKAGSPVKHVLLDSVTHQVMRPEEQVKGFFTTYTTEDGLALESIWGSLADRDGNLWFSTDGGGVSRYDGQTFTNYTVDHGLASNVAFAIMQEETSRAIWFGTVSGASRFDGKSFTTYTVADGLGSDVVVGIFQDRSGIIWFCTEGGGLTHYDGKRLVNLTTAEGLVNNSVYFMIEETPGNFLIGTAKGLSRYDGKKFYTIPQFQNRLVECMVKDDEGNIWLGTDIGAFQYRADKLAGDSAILKISTKSIAGIIKDHVGNIWMATRGDGVIRYDGKDFTRFTIANGLPINVVYSISEDNTGNLWFGTAAGGLVRYGGQSFMNYTGTFGFNNDFINGMLEDKAGKLWFGTVERGVSSYDGESISTYTTSQGLPDNRARPIFKDKKGNVWIYTRAGLSCFDGATFTNYTHEDGLGSTFILCMAETRDGKIWFGGNEGVTCYDGTSFINYSEEQGLVSNGVHNISEDAKGNLWLGTVKGLSRFDGSSFTNYTKENGIPNTFVQCSALDREGNLWVGTQGGGVSRFDGTSFINFTVAQGLPDNNVWAITIDSAGKIILGTNAGLGILAKFNDNLTIQSAAHTLPAQNVLKNEELKNYKPQFEIYNVSAGYPIKDLAGQGMFQDGQGNVWVATGAVKNGIIRFNYSEVHRGSIVPILHSVKINNENVCWSDLLPQSPIKDSAKKNPDARNTEEATTLGFILTQEARDSMLSKFSGIEFDSVRRFYPVPENLVLPYYHNNISFDYGAVALNSPKLVRYQYMLEGYDKEWSPVTNKTSASFGNLREGAYNFKLRAQTPNGAWSDPVVYTFKVLSPWYRTWWAYGLYILVSLIALWGFVKWRVHAVQKENKVLEEKIMHRTKELKHSLEDLRSTQTQLIQQEKMASLGELTAGIAHEIQNPLNFVNNFSEVNKEMLAELKEEIRKGNYNEVNVIADDIEANEEKINHHGKRAGAIVKSMLEHSKTSKGIKEPTDINKLAEEYLQLSYHGLRAKDKSFTVHLKKDFDQSIGKINIVPQDIGRVLLNLINNAFYAVNEKRTMNKDQYEPAVTVSTKKIGDTSDLIEISVTDNGNGIPESIKEKIFQPFFTTKPTGQGTGLGLSLAYDIIKAHGGEIKVGTTPGEGSSFIIYLPKI